MSGDRRPSVLYMVPGHDFLPSAGPTRNVVNQARAMGEWASVTLAFRTVVEPTGPEGPEVLEIDPRARGAAAMEEDAGTRGMSYRGFMAYLRTVRRFLATRPGPVDWVLEKDWMLTGYVGRECRRRGIPSVPVKNWVAGWRPGAIRHAVGAWIEGRLLRGAPCVVAETELLKRSMVERWRLDPRRVEVIGLGVDRELFRPSDREAARARLGISRESTVLLYVGILDGTHDLEPLLGAVVRLDDPTVQLHVVGDGPARPAYERRARAAPGAVVLHGRVPHEEVPGYVAAADLCVAPYDPSSFPRGEVAYSTLKVREYLSAGRPVATVDSGSLRTLVEEGESGFLLDNDEDTWRAFLEARPTRDRLSAMGRAAAATELAGWDDVSRAFERLYRRQHASTATEAGSLGGVAP